jgi:4-hydroxy-tetrahydrodipicolinate reductase
MKILLLGCGKTGSLVEQVARERGHEVEVLTAKDNPNSSALTGHRLAPFAVVIEFTTPHCVLDNITACVGARKNMVVGTTGWYSGLAKVKAEVELHDIGFLYGSNFSFGVNLFFDLVRAAVPALQHRYGAQIYERHHQQKKDAPSGTAAAMQRILEEGSGGEVEINSENDSIYLCHDAKSRRGFAEGAVRAAEWIAGKKGFFDFKDIWKQI